MVVLEDNIDLKQNQYIHTRQKFYFDNCADLLLHLITNQEKIKTGDFSYNNSLDKTKSNVVIHDDNYNADNNNYNNDYDDNNNDNIVDTYNNENNSTQLSSLSYKPPTNRDSDKIDIDELLDKVFDVYTKFSEIRESYISKMGKSEYLKNELTIINDLLKEEDEKKKTIIKQLTHLSDTHKLKHIIIKPHDPLCRLQNQYDNEVNRIYGESQVNSNKKYFRYIFIAIEVIFTFSGFDMTGYTEFNMEKISDYEALLVEIGAIKPLIKLNLLDPIVKLGLLFSFNTLCFIGAKVAIKYDNTGGLLFNSIGNIFGTFLKPASNNNINSASAQPIMRGPR
jgi:hypothetical protein